MNEKQLTVGLIFFIVLTVLFGVYAATGGNIAWPKKSVAVPAAPEAFSTARNAYDIAILRARAWQPDSRLAFVQSGEVDVSGRSSHWELLFVSSSVNGRGYRVEVSGFSVLSEAEIPYANQGADFPADLISPEEAIQIVTRMKGYGGQVILGVEAVYGEAEGQWYWGVRTPKGVVSVSASR
ncbi:MAG: hypothetical protein HY475_02885 [Candidatus Terrybacteria bacterium]|nr:hypothetical protein [Candidatus Terrybacteria bacterium]